MYTLVGEIPKWYEYFLRFLGFPILFGKVFLIIFKLSLIELFINFKKKQCKQVTSTRFFTFVIKGDYNSLSVIATS